jgi:CBS domain-containing protein
LSLAAETAADLMRPNPISIREYATLQEAVALLLDEGFSAAPVVDCAGRPVGVVSRTDIIAHDREKLDEAPQVHEYYDDAEWIEARGKGCGKGFQVVTVDRTQVADIMTPVVFCVAPHTPVRKVVQEMLAFKVHRLFVVDRAGVLVGVISASDILGRLQ